MVQLITADYIKKERASMLDEQLNKINKDLVKLINEPWTITSCNVILHDEVVNLLKEAGYSVEDRTKYTDSIMLYVSII